MKYNTFGTQVRPFRHILCFDIHLNNYQKNKNSAMTRYVTILDLFCYRMSGTLTLYQCCVQLYDTCLSMYGAWQNVLVVKCIMLATFGKRRLPTVFDFMLLSRQCWYPWFILFVTNRILRLNTIQRFIIRKTNSYQHHIYVDHAYCIMMSGTIVTYTCNNTK